LNPDFDLNAEPLRERLFALAIQARDMLPPAEQQRRRAWCAIHHDDSLTVTADAGDVVVSWGASPLLTVGEALLRRLRDDEHVDLALGLAPDVPDDLSSMDGDTL
jgi:hypothetical protein